MNTAIFNALIENPSVFFLMFIVEPFAGTALAYVLVWLAMRPKDGRKVHNPFLLHLCGVATTAIGSAIFRVIAMVTFAGRNAYEPASETGAAGFYMLVIPAIIAAVYIAWLKNQVEKNTIRTCPYCAEQIKSQATICRFCQKDLPTLHPDSLDKAANSVKRTCTQRVIMLRDKGFSYYLIAQDFNEKNVPIPERYTQFQTWSPKLVKLVERGN